ncbi:glucose-6-phosphate dehydrogenase [Microbacterium sp. SORGH_AS_0888]|uniref:glucose-6-phosphate dehydrogenase n=1 Tax=Microbacterium sp. SORGH_AS_0888 TaxID=3041791 RepID=UPI002781FDDD|nr:glucose-6-phosphate dehydrogenase [Microbacterium sp. SORGH_AS_0888]MDQ1131316.1 hypothetical protein [Microbacterium sp. SORGH_AS_0888]
MRVNSGSDWRDTLAFEVPVVLAELVPGEPARCVACGPTADAVAREQLLAYKHRHPRDHGGYVRFYCAEHVPAAVVAAPAVTAPAARAAHGRAGSRAAEPRAERAPRRPAVVERPRAVCPTCFMEVPPTGVCGSCGEPVAR